MNSSFLKISALMLMCFSLGAYGLFAQNLSGKIVDFKTHEALPFANVFLNNTTTGTVTDAEGNFVLNNISPGSYELVVSFVGYLTYKGLVSIPDAGIALGVIEMTPSQTQLSNVDVVSTRDKSWEKNLRRFEKIFLGEDKFASSCKITNAWVIDFPRDTSGNKLLATASEAIEIVNYALGYKVYYYLSHFESEKNDYLINGNIRFEELQPVSMEQLLTWKRNREESFRNSYNYFFKMLLTKNLNGAGFELLYPNNNEESIKILGFAPMIRYDTAGIIFQSEQPNEFKVRMKGTFQIRDTYAAKESLIIVKADSVVINTKGFVLNPTDIAVSGVYAKNRLATLLPTSYNYKNSDTVSDNARPLKLSFTERVYIHTDKPYYYPGEALWFKGYMNYNHPEVVDLPSGTIYVELINPEKKVLQSRTLKISDGTFDNQFILPDTLREGNYHLRAYTNYNRNFGDENLYAKLIPLLKITSKVDPSNSISTTTQESTISVAPDKTSYKPREKITLTIKLQDESHNAIMANLSISVTDATQVVPIDTETILENALNEDGNIEREIKFESSYSVEKGISFSGRFYSDKNKPEKADLMVMQFYPRYFTTSTSDEYGFFNVQDLTFYDSTQFSIQASNKKGKLYGRAEIIPRELVPISLKENNHSLTFMTTQVPQRVISEYEVPRDARMLENVEVRGNRIPEEYEKDYRTKRPYGAPDYVIDKKKINTGNGNLLLSLQGQVPGLVVRQDESGNWLVYTQRAAGASIANVKQVNVTVNDVFLGGTPETILRSLDPNTIESIEVKLGINVLYGSAGANGIVAVYLKNAFTEQTENVNTISTVKVKGYNLARSFLAPDYDNPKTDKTLADYRSTIYWNPNITTNHTTGLTTVSFFAADLAGTYRVVIEGITANGEVLRHVSYLTIDSN